MIRGLKNRKHSQAYQRGGYYNWLMWLDEQYTDEEKLNALKLERELLKMCNP